MTVPLSGSPIVAAFQRAAGNTAHQILAYACPPAAHAQATPSPTPSDNQQVVLNSTSTENAGPTKPKTSRTAQNVLTIADRTKIASWMTIHSSSHGTKNIASKTVSQFPHFFRSSTNANLQKATRIWDARAQYVDDQGDSKTKGSGTAITRCNFNGLKRVNMKARSGRGRKTRVWVRELQLDMVDEFHRLRKLGVKFNWKTLHFMALKLICDSTKPSYHKFLIDSATNKVISQCINRRWIQSFTDRYRIVSRARTGKHLLSPEKQSYIEKTVAFHLGQVARAFRKGDWDDCDVENADETHFLINMDNGRTLGFCGEKEVKYSDVVSGGEGMTMVVRISGGAQARIEPVFMVFQNKNRSYPIRGVPDSVTNVSYRTGPKGWMDTIVMPQWLNERKVIGPLQNQRRRVLFVDNCSGHNSTPGLEAAAQGINTEIRYFPPSCTDLVQPADSFIIQKIKSAWNARWEKYKMEKVKQQAWSNSGKVLNPGKGYFLRLAALAVQDVNRQRDGDGLTYARKAMIRTGLSLNLNGLWEERQLFPRLQEIITKHRSHFDGQAVVE